MDGSGSSRNHGPKTTDPSITECWSWGYNHADRDGPGSGAPGLLVEAWQLMRAPLNLAEYAEIDVYWYRELGAALAAWNEGRSQKRDIAQRLAQATASHRTKR